MPVAGNITDIRNGIATNAATIEGLRVHAEVPEQVVVPSFVVLGVNEITFDETMVRGTDRMTFDCVIVASRADVKNAQRTLDAYLSTSGVMSLKVALESDRTLGGAAADMRVTRVSNYGSIDIAGVTYLSARFELDVYVDN